MANKLLVVLITCLVASVIYPFFVTAEDECISCERFSPPVARALFLIDAVLGKMMSYNSQTFRALLDKNKAGKTLYFYWDASAKKGEENVLNEILNYLVDITEVQCGYQGTWSDVLTSFEARILEGENPKKKNEMTPFGLPYRTRDISIILEDQHYRLIESCRDEAMQMAQKFNDFPVLQPVRQAFIDYAKYLEKSALETSERNSLVLAKISAKRDKESNFGYLNRGRKLLSWEYLFEKVKSRAAGFFVQEGSGLNCTESLEENLVKKYESYMAQIAKVLDPLNKLTSFKPEHYVQIPPEQKKGRKIFSVAEEHADFLNRNKDVAELVELYSFWKTILKRKDEICSQAN